jgi:hypothetical protein
VYDLVYVLKMAENFDMDSSFSSGLDTNFNSKVLQVLLSKGEIPTSRIEQHYSQPGNEMEKTLSELAETNNDDDLLYSPSVMQSSVCVANCKNKCRGKCAQCGKENTFRRYLSKPRKEIKSSMDPDSFSAIPHEYLFAVGRHTAEKTMHTFHRFRCEAFYYK